ncbi:LysR substrate-binding domain-containing protein [Altericroceibacterium endophyticum]|uniref:LysR family transcriptional regulator n=1 Tax=Altericroceibacterium endophyticum TaxID=1808508 RepID=A0A6I4T7M9_9SPHN|nr:LysR substrate-binding domain-containing protein [Altericroceibacterium endophyticum]MXO66688.1 LysR family transcriptional regulator [Altericroceibacterium endophyticum]
MSDEKPFGALPDRKDIPPFAALRAFDAAARLGGVRKAARALQLDHAVISRHIRSLESWTNLMLVDRSHSRLTLTEEGQQYHKRVAQGIDLLAEATRDLIKQHDASELTIWCTPGFASKWLLPRLGQVEEALPQLGVDVRPADQLPDFNRQEGDIDIRYAPIYGQPLVLPPNVRSFEFASPDVIPVASPAYLEQAPPVRTARDLVDHPLIHEESFENWQTWLTRHGADAIAVSGPKLWHAHLTIDAAVQGRGITLANHFLAADALAKGDLVEVEGSEDQFERISLGSYLLVARSDRWNTLPISRFRDWLGAAVASSTRNAA